MRKMLILFVFTLLVLVLSSLSYPGVQKNSTDYIMQDTAVTYRDGTWTGSSRASYTDEPYWGLVRLSLKSGKLKNISFIIRDSNLHETFDAQYEKHFEGNPVYIQQCRNDWKGVQEYPGKLLKNKDINKVDAMTGATWSYNIFRASVEDALKKAIEQGK